MPQTLNLAAWLPLAVVACMPCQANAQLALFGGHYYGFTSQTTDWQAAQAEAVGYGGYLVSIASAAENQFLVVRFLAAEFGQARPYWIGLSDAAVEGVFFWASGEPLAYTNWAPGEPNNAAVEGGEDYAAINWQFANLPGGARGTWNDVPLAGTTTGNDESDGPYRGIFELPFSYSADFEGDGDVDGADLARWRSGFGVTTGALQSQGDADGNGAVDGADLIEWQRELGEVALPAAAALPEPRCGALLLAALGTAAAFRSFGINFTQRKPAIAEAASCPRPSAPLCSRG